MADTKTCSECKASKPIARFPEDGRTADGRSGTCVTCRFGSNHAEKSFANDLETVDLNGVELLSVGGPYFGTGSPEEGDHFEESYLQELAANALALRDELHAPIKIGHSKGQRLLKNSGLFVDEQPAAGWIENQRVAGGKLLGDLKRVPKQLAALINTGAFRKRSVELSKIKSQLQDGKEFEVVSALSLLGAKAPAVRTLNDIVTQWYSDSEDHMEETVRLLLKDVENDTDARTFDVAFAEGDVIWNAENGSADWSQDLTAALNGSTGMSSGDSQDQPYWVQDIDQTAKRAIVCDYRTNAYWVVPFSMTTDGEPAPAPQETWTLAEQAWIQAAPVSSASGQNVYAAWHQKGDRTWNTFSMSDTATEQPKAAELSDEQIEKLAETFGITEEDASKRREAVNAKFTEFAPKVVESVTTTEENIVIDSEKVEDDSVALSATEKEKLMADAKAGREFADRAFSDRVEANLNWAAKVGKIDPKDFPHYRTFMEQNYELAVDALAKLPINRELLVSYGSDESGEGADNRDEQLYRAYAGLTQVPMRPKEGASS